MTLEESREVIPIMEDMINQIEKQQEIVAEMFQEMQNRDVQLTRCQEQNKELQKLNSELQEQLKILPSTEEMLFVLEKQDSRIKELETENQQWKELAGQLNRENAVLQKQNIEWQKLENR